MRHFNLEPSLPYVTGTAPEKMFWTNPLMNRRLPQVAALVFPIHSFDPEVSLFEIPGRESVQPNTFGVSSRALFTFNDTASNHLVYLAIQRPKYYFQTIKDYFKNNTSIVCGSQSESIQVCCVYWVVTSLFNVNKFIIGAAHRILEYIEGT